MSRMKNPLPPDTEMIENEAEAAPNADIGLSAPVGAPGITQAATSTDGPLTVESLTAPEAKRLLTRAEFARKYPPPANTRSWLPKHYQTPAEKAATAKMGDPPVTKLSG